MTSARDSFRAKRGRRKHGPAFVQLHYFLLDSAAWHSLSFAARAAYIELARRYNGLNNGAIAFSVRDLAEAMPCNKETASRALTELELKGLVAVAKVGAFKRRDRMATEYRLTCHQSDMTGQPATRDFDPSKKWNGATVRIFRRHGTEIPDSAK